MTSLMTPQQIHHVADELVDRIGVHTEHAIYDWLYRVCPNPMDQRRLLLAVASMVPESVDAKLVRERFNPAVVKK